MGNKLGWILSGVFVFIVITAAVIIIINPFASFDPVRLKPGDMKKIEISDKQFAHIVGSMPSGGGNAAEDYKLAVDLCDQIKDKLGDEKFLMEMYKSSARLDASTLAVCQKIRKHVQAGISKKKMDYTLKYSSGPFISVCPEADELYNVSSAMISLLMRHYLNQKDYDKCIAIARETLVLGWHMVSERGRAPMFRQGLAVQQDSIEFLKVCYMKKGNEPKMNIAQDYGNLLFGAVGRYEILAGAVNRQEAEPGDLVYMIENSEDRMWKAEAIVWLKFIRDYTLDYDGSVKRKFGGILDKYRSSSDPYIKKAVKSVEENPKVGEELLRQWMGKG